MDDCQNVIAYDDFDAIDDATENTTANMVTLPNMISSIFFMQSFSCSLPFCLFAILIT